MATLAYDPPGSNTLSTDEPLAPLYRGLARDPEAIAVEEGETRRTYAELVSDVEALATAFQALDPTPLSRVGICAFNTREHLTALLATYAAGKVWVPLNPRNGRAELDAMIALTAPGIIVADESCVDRFTTPAAALVLGRRGTVGAADGRIDRGHGGVDALIARHRGARPEPVSRAASDPVIIKFSGGTTGTPKAVVQPARCVRAQVEGIGALFEFRPDDRNLIAAPLTHGTSCFVLPVLDAGGTLVMLDKATAPAILEAFETRGITTTYLPPSLIYAMLAVPVARPRQFPALRHLIYSAQAMPPERIREARAFFGPVIETAYGQVEAPQIITALRAFELEDERNLESVGRPSPVARVEVMDPNGKVVSRGELGEVVVQGALVMTGYLGMPDLTAQTIVDGWLHTGDLGLIDERGYLYLKGRLRDVIISGGFNVFPADVEAVLSRHPAVRECCVFGVPSEKWGEEVQAAVLRREHAEVSEAELVSFVKSELDSVKAPKAVHFVGALPRNAAGKVVRRAVRATVIGEEEPLAAGS